MKTNYFRGKRKWHIHDEDIELMKETRDYRKYSRGAVYAGVLGLAVSAAAYCFTGEPSSETLIKSFNELNNSEITFAVSSGLFFGGEILYWLSEFMKQDYISYLKKERKSQLEKGLKDNNVID